MPAPNRSAGSATTRRRAHGPRDLALREARSCYRHLAGARGVQLYDALISNGYLRPGSDGPVLTASGADFVRSLGVDPTVLKPQRAPLCRDCLDWSERRPHLGGRLGLARMAEAGWLSRDGAGQTIRFTPVGADSFARAFPPG